MIYPYAVKHNGKWYRPYDEVPDTVKTDESANQRGIPLIEEVRGADETAETETVETDNSAPVEDVPRKRGRKPKY